MKPFAKEKTESQKKKAFACCCQLTKKETASWPHPGFPEVLQIQAFPLPGCTLGVERR